MKFEKNEGPDLVGLMVYADTSHAHLRTSWRSFLTLLLPLLLDTDPKSLEDILKRAMVRHVEDLYASEDAEITLEAVIREISSDFAESLGLETELGLAAFLENSNPPTRTHSVGKPRQPESEQKLIADWFNAFSIVQNDEEFISSVSDWRNVFEECSGTEVESRSA